MFGDDITKATGDWKGLRIIVKPFRTDKSIEVLPSASALIIKALKEPHETEGKKKH